MSLPLGQLSERLETHYIESAGQAFLWDPFQSKPGDRLKRHDTLPLKPLSKYQLRDRLHEKIKVFHGTLLKNHETDSTNVYT